MFYCTCIPYPTFFPNICGPYRYSLFLCFEQANVPDFNINDHPVVKSLKKENQKLKQEIKILKQTNNRMTKAGVFVRQHSASSTSRHVYGTALYSRIKTFTEKIKEINERQKIHHNVVLYINNHFPIQIYNNHKINETSYSYESLSNVLDQ